MSERDAGFNPEEVTDHDTEQMEEELVLMLHKKEIFEKFFLPSLREIDLTKILAFTLKFGLGRDFFDGVVGEERLKTFAKKHPDAFRSLYDVSFDKENTNSEIAELVGMADTRISKMAIEVLNKLRSIAGRNNLKI